MHTQAICFGCVCLVLILIILARVKNYLWTRTLELPYPPGPKPLPVIGNLKDLPRKDEVAVYSKWAAQYGDLVHISVFGKHIVFVNSFQVANELFEKRSSNYSDRNKLHMINDLMGWDWSFGHMPYGERWRRHRKLFHRQFQPSVVNSFFPIHIRETHALLKRLLDTPDDMINHLRHNAASTIMKVTYGIDVAPRDDYYINIAERALDGMAKAASPGAFLVDLVPILKYIPQWVPGAGFQRLAWEWKKVTHEMRDAPFQAARSAMSNGVASPSFVSNLLAEVEPDPGFNQQIETIRNCAGLAYAAGAESTVSALSAFVLAMVIYPQVQRKAQEELDRVVGTSRLPGFEDRDSLPYIDAIVKEVLRWNPVAPLGLPHMATQDDEYNGFFIPAGTTVIGNTWTMLHDPRIFDRPEVFDPERYLSNLSLGSEKLPPSGNRLESLADPVNAAFGYGRRICPGRFMADAQLWICIASILAVFDVRPGMDEDGKPVRVQARFDTGMISHPLPFRHSITPRSNHSRGLITESILCHGLSV
ncbi:hypothetical protein HGRIS_014263 [Hohenbuehelia grisea]|uniref:Cytochrome P450 n=1 Tax=Hohenbuehelia grisea TaxID=104357 RepID=A0ABR3JT20_9AGAR